MSYAIKNEVPIIRLFDEQPIPVIWMKPFFSSKGDKESIITDFKVTYYNKAAARILNISAHDILDRALIKDRLLGAQSDNFEESLQIFINGGRHEYTYYDSALSKHLNVITTCIDNGLLKTVTDITGQLLAERKVREQEQFLEGILDASINAVFVCEAIRDAAGKIEDLQMVKINRAFTEMIG